MNSTLKSCQTYRPECNGSAEVYQSQMLVPLTLRVPNLAQSFSKGSSQHSSRWVISPYRYWGVIERMLQVVGEGFCPVCPSSPACPASAALSLQGCSTRSRKKRAISMLYFFSELSKDQSFGGGMRVHILAWKVNLQNERKCRISKYKILLID